MPLSLAVNFCDKDRFFFIFMYLKTHIYKHTRFSRFLQKQKTGRSKARAKRRSNGNGVSAEVAQKRSNA
jgi:hypothetical protein